MLPGGSSRAGGGSVSEAVQGITVRGLRQEGSPAPGPAAALDPGCQHAASRSILATGTV